METGIKFGRSYLLEFQVYKRLDNNQLELDPEWLADIDNPSKKWQIKQTLDEEGLFLEFDVKRGISNTTGNASLKIYNLPTDFRDMLRKDNETGGGTKGLDTKIIHVWFSFGYGEYMSTVLFMDVIEAQSTKSGTEWITNISLGDGVLDLSGVVFLKDFVITKGTPILLAMQELIAQFPNIDKGVIDEDVFKVFGNTIRDNKYLKGTKIGDAIDKLIPKEIDGEKIHWYVDNGKINILKETTAIDHQDILEISEETGLLGTPQIKESRTQIVSLLEPKLIPGQFIKMKYKSYDGTVNLDHDYKVSNVNHKGDSQTGECTTTIETFFTAKDLVKKSS